MSITSDSLQENSDRIFSLLAASVEPIIEALEECNTEGKYTKLLHLYKYLNQQLTILKLQGVSYFDLENFVIDNSHSPESTILLNILRILKEPGYVEEIEETDPRDLDFPPQ